MGEGVFPKRKHGETGASWGKGEIERVASPHAKTACGLPKNNYKEKEKAPGVETGALLLNVKLQFPATWRQQAG